MASFADRLLDQAKRAMGHMDSYVNMSTGMGGVGDKGAAGVVNTGARKRMNVEETDYLSRFDGYIVSWLTRASNDATLAGWKIESKGDRLEQFDKLNRDLKVGRKFRMAFKAALESGASLIIPVTPGAGTLDTPLDLTKVKTISAIHVLDSDEFQIHERETDYQSPEWRQPSIYTLSPKVSGVLKGIEADGGGQIKIHASRVIYLHGRELLDRVKMMEGGKDASMIEAVFDQHRDIRSVDQGAATLAQEMKETVIKLIGLNGMAASDAVKSMRDRLQTIMAGKGLLGAIVLREGDDYQSTSANASGYKDLNAGSKSAWAAGSMQPETVAFGATPGGLNTDGEAGRKFHDRVIAAYQETHLRVPLERFYTIMIAGMPAIPDTWKLIFNPLEQLGEKDRSEVWNKDAQTDRIYYDLGVLTIEEIRKYRFGEDGRRHIGPIPIKGKAVAKKTGGLDAAQFTAVMGVLEKVAGESLPPEAAIEGLVHMFGMTRTAAKKIVGKIGTEFTAQPMEMQMAEKQAEMAEAVDVRGAEASEASDGRAADAAKASDQRAAASAPKPAPAAKPK